MAKARTLSQKITDAPMFLLVVASFSAAMFVPAVVGRILDEDLVARTFFYAGLLGLISAVFISIALYGRRTDDHPLSPLLTLFASFSVLPLVLAIPFHEAVQTTTFMNAYFEMVSSITTTGATVFADPERLSPALHLWRAQVGWMGGLILWVAAIAVLAPLSLGGFELAQPVDQTQRETRFSLMDKADPKKRILRSFVMLAPVYIALTAALWVLLIIAGDTPLIALCHAMSTLATSGISPVGGLTDTGSRLTGEVLILCFLIFALSRMTFTQYSATPNRYSLRNDPEFRLGLIIIVAVPTILFMRHWLGAIGDAREDDLATAVYAFWGALFTIASFLTTTGFESSQWDTAQTWSGLPTPGLILMGLALMGGGVATTAGGVKLLRVYALYLNGRRELYRLVHPSSVGTGGDRKDRRFGAGAFSAWIFFMLFALSLAVVTVALTLSGVGFEQALVLSISSLTTTGPLTEYATQSSIDINALGGSVKAILCTAMVLGRLETLAIVALISPEMWRD